jgi:uncharacterized membrane protein
METQIFDWLNLVVRWAHILVGIGWIGSSFFFVWLDGNLEKPSPPQPGLEGELWMVHSGGFYRTEKIMVAPGVMPRHLHWFRWEAAFTWISGMTLLLVVYYLGSSAFLIDPAVADLSRDAAAVIVILAFVGTWLAYDLFWITPFAERGGWLPQAISFLAAVGVACGFAQFLSGRAAYIHTGAVLGTIMVANVWVRIIPAQRALIAASKAGTKPDPALAHRAKQRSMHNSYMTLPVIFIMISSHYPFTYSHPWNWLILVGLSIVGAGMRYWMIVFEKGRNPVWIPIAAAAALLPIGWFAANPPGRAEASAGPPVAFAEVQAVVVSRCQACHSARPTDDTVQPKPGGVALDSPAEIRLYAQRMRAQAVLTRAMPLGNKTGMKDEERELLGRWIAQGAKVK